MPEPGESSEVAIVREGLEVLANEGPNALLDRYEDFFTEDFEWRPVLIGSVEGERTFVGKKQFALYWREFTGAFGRPGFGELWYESIGAGRVLATGHIKATGVGSVVPIDREVAYLFELEGGLVVSALSFLSRREAEEFLARA
jgi:hypothetical protein